MVHLYSPCNLWLSDVFRGYTGLTLVENGLILFFQNAALFQFHKTDIVLNIEKTWTVIKEVIGFENRWISVKLVCHAKTIIVF